MASNLPSIEKKALLCNVHSMQWCNHGDIVGGCPFKYSMFLNSIGPDKSQELFFCNGEKDGF
jgi:hypothetical protein